MDARPEPTADRTARRCGSCRGSGRGRRWTRCRRCRGCPPSDTPGSAPTRTGRAGRSSSTSRRPRRRPRLRPARSRRGRRCRRRRSPGGRRAGPPAGRAPRPPAPGGGCSPSPTPRRRRSHPGRRSPAGPGRRVGVGPEGGVVGASPGAGPDPHGRPAPSPTARRLPTPRRPRGRGSGSRCPGAVREPRRIVIVGARRGDERSRRVEDLDHRVAVGLRPCPDALLPARVDVLQPLVVDDAPSLGGAAAVEPEPAEVTRARSGPTSARWRKGSKCVSVMVDSLWRSEKVLRPRLHAPVDGPGRRLSAGDSEGGAARGCHRRGPVAHRTRRPRRPHSERRRCSSSPGTGEVLQTSDAACSPAIGQGHAQQPLVHVLGRAVSRPVGGMDIPARRQRSRRRDMSGASSAFRRDVTGWLHRHRPVARRPGLHGRPVPVPGALRQ